MMYTELFKKWLWLLPTRNNLESLVELIITFEPMKTCEHAIILEASISKIKSLCYSFKRNLNDMSMANYILSSTQMSALRRIHSYQNRYPSVSNFESVAKNQARTTYSV